MENAVKMDENFRINIWDNDYLPMYTRWDGYVANRMFDAYRVESYLKRKVR